MYDRYFMIGRGVFASGPADSWGPLGKHIVHRDFVQRRHVLKGAENPQTILVQSRNQTPIALLQSFKFRFADGHLNG